MEKIEKKPLGVIDALSGGFERVVRRPWILLIPVALDLFLWLGPQLSAQPVFQQLASFVSAASVQGAPPEALQNVEALKSALQTAGEQFNVFSLLALFAIGMPTLMGLGTPPADFLSRTAVYPIRDGLVLLGWVGLFGLVGLFLATVYLQILAGTVKSDAPKQQSFAPRLARSYLNILALIIFGIVGALALMVPFAIGATLVSFVNEGLGSFFIVVGSFVLLWAALYLAFAIPAIFVGGASVFEAIANSISVFRYNFWSALALVFLIYLLQMGFSVIWDQFLNTTWGVLIDVIANAFLGTALVAAEMLFYDDRFTWLTQVRERIRQHQRPIIKG
ncbi:MAG: hypothetical protein M1132_09130 [Chloroflexi bacterium]|nr:hypothetical protein [Chloroflexota bacterium]MCL5951869.1 hypothetical protein [Chloroflexota bacterium]